MIPSERMERTKSMGMEEKTIRREEKKKRTPHWINRRRRI